MKIDYRAKLQATLFAILFCSVSCSDSGTKGFGIHFGILALDRDGNPTAIKEETRNIPLRYRGTGFRWGCEVTPSNNEIYTVQFILHLPAPAKIISGNAWEAARASDHKTMTFPVTPMAKGKPAIIPLWFDVGDPIGNWRLEVVIDGRLEKTVEFQVIGD